MKLIRVLPPNLIVQNQSVVLKLLKRAMAYHNGETDIDSILFTVLSGACKLIACMDDDKIEAICIIETINYPLKRVLNIAFLSSDCMDKYEPDFLRFINTYAHMSKCDAIQCKGRKGWKRLLSKYGYSEIYTVLEKEVV